MGSLEGRVAVVTGSSRGIGKGIALVLAEQGATVYVTGRTATPGSSPLPGTVGETAEECTRRGGKGIAVVVDHADLDQIAVLFDQVKRDEGWLDILVNNAFQLPDDLFDKKAFWEKPLSNLRMLDAGVRSSFVASWYAAQMMVPRRTGLIVQISGYTGVTYTHTPLFGMCKSAVDRLSHDMAVDLEPHNVCSISLWQALTITERVQQILASDPIQSKAHTSAFGEGASVEHPGRVIAALAADPDVMRHSGGTFITAEIAQEYGVVDVDGRIIASMSDTRGAPIWKPIQRPVSAE